MESPKMNHAFQLKRRRTGEETRFQHRASSLLAGNKLESRKSAMNTIRMFAFALAVLGTAYLLRVFVDELTPEQPIPTAIGHAAPASTDAQSAPDRSSL
jgi:hypothetical protein